jgi:ubiquinone/menaquinone biosynthesis C-methylase UbiE
MTERETSWGGVAGWYDALLEKEKGTYQREVVLPNLLRLMAIKDGETVVDVACGQGFFAAAFFNAGANVVGADVAPEMIAIARTRVPTEARGGRALEYRVAPSDDMASVADGAASQAAIILAVQNIDDVKGTFEECGRVLEDGGRLHVVMNHPAFRVPKRSAWGWDNDGTQFRRIDGYLTESKERIQMHPGAAPDVTTVSFHRPLQYYVKALARSGFLVANLEEWISHKVSDSGPRAASENVARKEIPMFLYLQAVKRAAV